MGRDDAELRHARPLAGADGGARRDVVIGGRLIREGEPIALVYTSANRDEEIFENGEEFVLDRPNLRAAIPFGAGIQACPGAPLARMMLRMTLEELLARTTAFAVSGEILMARWAEWGTRSVPMRFTPAVVTRAGDRNPLVATSWNPRRAVSPGTPCCRSS